MKEKLQKFFQSINSINKDKLSSRKSKYLIVVALLGLLLLIIGNMFTGSTKEVEGDNHIANLQEEASEETITKEKSTESAVDELESSYEKNLQAMLEKVQGVSDVEVMVNLDSNNVKVYEKNLILGQQTSDETDKSGGIRKVEDNTEETQVVLVRQGDQEVPLLIQTKKPDVRGVFVVAKGVDHATVKMWVIEAVARVLDVPTHKVSVMPKS